MSEKNKDAVRKVNEALLAGNAEGFLDFCADDVQWTIAGEKTVKGKETTRQWMQSMAKENPEPPKFTVADPLIADGDFVVSRGDMTMKDKEGKEGHYAYCDVYRFSGDKIVELNSYVVKTEPKAEAKSN